MGWSTFCALTPHLRRRDRTPCARRAHNLPAHHTPSRRPLPKPEQRTTGRSTAECCRKKEKEEETRATMRQTSGRVAVLTVAVCCLLGLLSGPHQALAQGSLSQSGSSSIADSTGAFPVSINNADAFASSFRPYGGYYGGY